MKATSPLTQMTMALVALCSMLVMLADLLFGVFPDRAEQQLRVNKLIGEALAVQVATLLRTGDIVALKQTLDEVALRTPSVRSMALRQADGPVLVQTGDHLLAWGKDSGGASTAERIDVPMNADGRRWGSFEIAFKPPAGALWWRWLTEPLVVTMIFVSLLGAVVFSLYMRRALQHLDPASVIPDRVQGAFDAMGEGVVVLDPKGRVLLANKAFKGLNAEAASLGTGKALSNQTWLSKSLVGGAGRHPWARTVIEGAGISGVSVEVPSETGLTQQLIINTVPITDAGGRVRGCLATFSDVSQLHRANAALRKAMGELSESQDQVQRQNVELKRLATRDPLTGCLNRRAFTEMFDHLFNGARATEMPLSCVILDIDHFKRVNDTYGHSVGDLVIQSVARKLTESARASDLVCRYGGEEFCMVLPGLDERTAAAFAERLRARIEAECGRAIADVPDMKVTVSVGLAVLKPQVSSGHELIDFADQSLYRAKRGGRNRVVVHDVLAPAEEAGNVEAAAPQAA